MTVNEFVEKVVNLHRWMIRISLMISLYFAYMLITPESIFGWLILPVLGIFIWYLLERLMKNFEFEA